MSYSFKNARLVVGTSAADLYTCPAATTAVVILLQAANVTTTPDNITAWWTDASNTNAVTRLGYNVTVPSGVSTGLLVGKLVLEAGDKIRAQCVVGSALELTASVMELV